jgi:predicted nucleotidyltransferase
MGRVTTPRAPDERDALVSRLRSVLDANPAVRWAYLFGSAARGEAFRDLDVGVVLHSEQGRGAVQFGSLVASLESAVPGVSVDLVDLAAAAPGIRGQAVREGILLIDRDGEARKDWEIDVARVWFDLEPWIRRGDALRLEALEARRGR